jgi:hypothetical protein
MAGSSKLHQTEETETEEKAVSLKDGKKLVVSEAPTGEQLVEIRAANGMLELRIKLTDQGPVLQMEAVKLELKATESVEIASERIELKGTKHVGIEGGQVDVDGKQNTKTEASGDVFVRGRTINLN